MSEEVKVNGLSELLAKLDSLKEQNDVYILFTGSKDSSGNSWCSDCNDADPVIKKCLPNAPEGSVFICCIVGDRSVWKDPENEFRKHPQFKLTGIPTLIKWKTANRLGPDDCKKQDLVEMIFED
ncbi:Hypothetical predicted protein [Paramuricea clavata]|uniref:Thioredoxin domain-containing protein 17 n=1 Tax=Paramuricea clavata TaxID=317549 RepID=A0A7D9DBH9_PARCT|nr:Hypothetical predicted protein [Paramuricea clavata]